MTRQHHVTCSRYDQSECPTKAQNRSACLSCTTNHYYKRHLAIYNDGDDDSTGDDDESSDDDNAGDDYNDGDVDDDYDDDNYDDNDDNDCDGDDVCSSPKTWNTTSDGACELLYTILRDNAGAGGDII